MKSRDEKQTSVAKSDFVHQADGFLKLVNCFIVSCFKTFKELFRYEDSLALLLSQLKILEAMCKSVFVHFA